MSGLAVVVIRQSDGGVRYLAVSAEDAGAVRSDRAMVERVKVLACLDAERGGGARWGLTGEDTPEGRAAIRAYRRGCGAYRNMGTGLGRGQYCRLDAGHAGPCAWAW